MSLLTAPNTRRRSPADHGMTVVEIMVAMAILLFVMTALWSLMLVSTSMGQGAKARALAVETANGYIEMVRALPYNDIGVAGGNPTGTLVAAKDYTQGGLNVRVVPSVSWEATAAPVKTYKVLSIQVAVTAGTRLLATYGATTYIRDRRAGVSSNVTDPKVRFSNPSPTNGEIIFGARDVSVTGDSSGESPDWGVQLAGLLIDGNDIRLAGSSDTASWTVPANIYLYSRTVEWNTASGAWPDGNVTLVAYARNLFGMIGVDSRLVLVDNYRPDVDPGPPTAVPTATDVAVPLEWTQSTDGTREVPRYYVTVYPEGSASAVPATTYETPPHLGTTIPYTLSTAPFSRYVLGVRGCGPRWPSPSDWTSGEAQSAPLTSRPRLTVTSASSTSHVLAVSTPTFNTVGSPTYTWYVSTDPGTGWTAWTALSTPTGDTFTNTSVSPSTLYRYRVKVDFVPTTGVATSIGTQVAAQTRADDYAFSEPADWTLWW